MAAPVQTSYMTVMSTPWTIMKHSFTSGVDATAFYHYGPTAIPDMVWCVNTTTNPGGNDLAVYSLTTTQFTLDCEDAADTFDVYFLWVDAAGGGIG